MDSSIVVLALVQLIGTNPVAGNRTFPRAPIETYPLALSVSQGDSLGFAVSSRTPRLELEITRVADPEPRVYFAAVIDGQLEYSITATTPSMGCGWPEATRIRIGEDWPSGVYHARFRGDGSVSESPFVVRARVRGSHSRVLLLRPDFTVHAYNVYGGACLYPSDFGDASPVVAFDRPIVSYRPGPPKLNEDFVTFLEQECAPIEYASEIDLHDDPTLLDDYDGLLLVGHHEYWSRAMRDAVDDFVGNGGRVVVMHGNTCYWQVRVEPGGRAIRCHKLPVADPIHTPSRDRIEPLVTTVFAYPPVLDPPDRTFGLDFRHASWGAVFAGAHEAPRTPGGLSLPMYSYARRFGGFRLAVDGAPGFEGLDLRAGDSFGAREIRDADRRGWVSVVRGEVDGANIERSGDAIVASRASGAPANLLVLATAPAEQGFAAIATFDDHGSVWNAGAEGWPEALDFSSQPIADVAAITRNVLRWASTSRRSVIRNGGFERWSGGAPVDVAITGTVRATTMDGSGRRAIELDGRDGSPSTLTLRAPIDATESGVFVGMFATSEGTPPVISVSDGSENESMRWVAPSTTDSYTFAWVELAPESEPSGKRVLSIEVQSTGGRVAIDQLEVIPASRFAAEREKSGREVMSSASRFLLLAPTATPSEVELEAVGHSGSRAFTVLTSILGPSGTGAVVEVDRRIAPGDLPFGPLRLRVSDPMVTWIPLRSASRSNPIARESLASRLVSDRFSNGDFELVPSVEEIRDGIDWSDLVPHWGASRSGVVRLDDSKAFHGAHSLRIDASIAPVRIESPIADPMATNVDGSIEMALCGSVGTVVDIAVLAAPFGKLAAKRVAQARVELDSEWRRQSLTVTPELLADLGVHLALQGWISIEVAGGTAWLDAVVVR